MRISFRCWIFALVTLAFAGCASARAQDYVNAQLPWHKVVLDRERKLLAWYEPSKQLGYDKVVRLAWDFIEHKVPVDPRTALKVISPTPSTTTLHSRAGTGRVIRGAFTGNSSIHSSGGIPTPGMKKRCASCGPCSTINSLTAPLLRTGLGVCAVRDQLQERARLRRLGTRFGDR